MFKQELNDKEYVDYQKMNDSKGFDIFGYLLEMKGYCDEEFIDNVLSLNKERTFNSFYNEYTQLFEIYERVGMDDEYNVKKITEFIEENRNDKDLAERIYSYMKDTIFG